MRRVCDARTNGNQELRLLGMCFLERAETPSAFAPPQFAAEHFEIRFLWRADQMNFALRSSDGNAIAALQLKSYLSVHRKMARFVGRRKINDDARRVRNH